MAETTPATLVTPELIAQRDAWTAPRTSPPIGLAEVRRWAIAVYWPEPPPRVFWTRTTRTTRYGGIVAPWDFNPVAWPLDRPPLPPGFGSMAFDAPWGQCLLNGGYVDRFGAPMRPGDVITESSALVGWEERETSLGLTLFSRYVPLDEPARRVGQAPHQDLHPLLARACERASRARTGGRHHARRRCVLRADRPPLTVR